MSYKTSKYVRTLTYLHLAENLTYINLGGSIKNDLGALFLT